jgi:uncharacterized protein
MRAFLSLFTTAILITAANSAPAQTRPAPTDTVETWRQQYDAGLRDEYGWLSVAGLTFLPLGTYTIGAQTPSDILLPAGGTPADVGRIEVADEGVTLYLQPGVEALING